MSLSNNDCDHSKTTNVWWLDHGYLNGKSGCESCMLMLIENLMSRRNDGFVSDIVTVEIGNDAYRCIRVLDVDVSNIESCTQMTLPMHMIDARPSPRICSPISVNPPGDNGRMNAKS
jgi:hypothetical protein